MIGPLKTVMRVPLEFFDALVQEVLGTVKATEVMKSVKDSIKEAKQLES